MKYLEFLNYIKSKNIYLFDAQSRIIYYKLFNQNNQNEQNQQNVQIGGNNIKLENIQNDYLFTFLLSVYQNNNLRQKYILDNYIN